MEARELGITNELVRQSQHERRFAGSPITPEGFARAFNREAQRLALKRATDKRAPEPVRLRKPVPPAEAIDRVVQLLLQSQPRLFEGTVEALGRFLSAYEEKVLREANARGLPLPREYIRAAIAAIYARGNAMRAEQARRATATTTKES